MKMDSEMILKKNSGNNSAMNSEQITVIVHVADRKEKEVQEDCLETVQATDRGEDDQET